MAVIKCPNCNQKTPDGSGICLNCGQPINSADVSVELSEGTSAAVISETENLKWYMKTWAIILFLILFFPIGLFLMWKYGKSWNKYLKIAVTILIAILFIANITSKNNNQTENETSSSMAEHIETTEAIKEKTDNESSIEETDVEHRIGDEIIGISNKSFADDDINVSLDNSVINDTTERWRLARIAVNNFDITEYALDYYKNYLRLLA